MKAWLKSIPHQATRTKQVTSHFLDTELRRCLSTFDITFIGVGHMIGAGIYVLTGEVAKKTAGPGILVSYIWAGIASIFSALCYAELGARVPKAGSAYTYTYVCVGELIAFVIGWDMVLEYMVGAAAVARSWSGYVQALAANPNVANGTAAPGLSFVPAHADWIAVIAIAIVCVFMAMGVKSSTNLNTFFTIVNLCVIVFVVIYGFILADPANWHLPSTKGDPSIPPAKQDYGGFLPFGFGGVLAAGATCFFAYAGFDGIATSGEEAANPGRSIPRATFFAMAIVTVCYCLMSSAITLMVPFRDISEKAAFAQAFADRGKIWAKYVVSVGAIAGMTTSLVGSLFSMPRTVYAMASDGLLFRCLSRVHPKTQVPLLTILIFGLITAVIALVLDVDVLVDLLAIGTLNAYSLVSASVIVLRYEKCNTRIKVHDSPSAPMKLPKASTNSVVRFFRSKVNPVDQENGTATLPIQETNVFQPEFDRDAGKLHPRLERIPFLYRTLGKWQPGHVVQLCTFLITMFFLVVGGVIKYVDLLGGQKWGWIIVGIFVFLIVMCTIIIAMFVQSEVKLRYRVHWVPVIPVISIGINTILVMSLDWIVWVRWLAWLVFGLLIYFFYGICHSSENEEYIGKDVIDNGCSPTWKRLCCCFRRKRSVQDDNQQEQT